MTTRSPARSASTSTAAFARYLLQAMGLGAAASTVLGGTACGAKVAIDGAGVGGDGTGGTTSTGTTTTTSTTTTTCDQQAEVYAPITQCIPQPGLGCPLEDDPIVFGSIYMQIQAQGCGGGDVASVMCGPEISPSGQCCYVVDAVIYECGGRPFVIEGAPCVAAIEPRSDWLARADAGIAALDAETRSALATAWTRSALDEHASVASFARFALELLATGAPADLVVAAQRAMGDEIRHAELCFGLASAYAGRALGPGPLPIDGAPMRAGLAEIAAAAVREGCVGETIAAFVAAVSRDEAEDASVREALDEIARDEAEHAALAFRFVAWVMRGGDARARAAVEEAFAAALASLPASAPDLTGDPTALRAHGHLPLTARRDLAARCLADVIAPCAQALLASPQTTAHGANRSQERFA